MTNEEVTKAFGEVHNDFWLRYRDRRPTEESQEWERMGTIFVVLKKKYPLMDEVINRMMVEITERARGRGNKTNDFHRPPT